MKTRYTYLGESTIEIVVDGETIDVNVLPSTVDTPIEQPTAIVSNPEPVVSSLLTVPEPVVAPPTKKKRTLMGTIRAVWFVIFTFGGEVVQYGIENFGGLNLPPRTGMIVGATLYGAKRALWPDTTL